MAVEVRIPQLGESITMVEIVRWLKHEGDRVEKDEALCEIETEKANAELPAPEAGILARILKQEGETASVGDVIAELDGAETPQAERPPRRKEEKREEPIEAVASEAAERPSPKKSPVEKATPETKRPREVREPARPRVKPRIMPAAMHAMAEHGLTPNDVEPTGPGGRILKEDVDRAVERIRRERDGARSAGGKTAEHRRDAGAAAVEAGPEEEVVPMSPMRRRIAARLVEAQQTAALLTTFNEIDCGAMIDLRRRFRDAFQEQYETKLGYTSFFVKAVVEALKRFPQLNAEIRGDNIVFRNHYDVGIAIGGGKGLVVPVLRHAERMSFAEIEAAVQDFARRAQESRLKVEDLEGGTFTITNGGVFGSLLSTPIVNPPQSGILGMHAIQERPVARDGNVVIRPMMYVALTYDHRIVDGREAVLFLRRVKELIEEPARIMLEV